MHARARAPPASDVINIIYVAGLVKMAQHLRLACMAVVLCCSRSVAGGAAESAGGETSYQVRRKEVLQCMSFVL